MSNTKNAQLPKCRLCKAKDANQTGSHILNFALIKNAINMEGSKKRDKEVSFTLSSREFVTPFIGRAVGDIKTEELFGRQMTDEEIASNANPYTVDHLLCSECEDRIERVESYFMDNVHAGLHTAKFPLTPNVPDLSIAECNGINEKLVRLYVYSLIWRSGETELMGFVMKPGHREYLRRILNENLDLDLKVAIIKSDKNESKINELPLIIMYLTTSDRSTENAIHIGFTPEPYFFIVSDISFQLFFKNKSVENHYYWQWGLCKFKRVKELVNWATTKPLRIGVVSEDFRREVIQNLYNHIVKQMVEFGLSIFSEGYQEIFHSKPHIDTANEIIKEFDDETVPLGERFSVQRFMHICAQKFADELRARGINVEDK